MAVATADFNADGKPDLAVGNAGSSSLSVFLGKGDGTFIPGTAVTLPGSCAVSYVGSADFNGDGKPDLLAVCGFQFTLWLALGDGNGKFQTPVETPITQLFYDGFAEGFFQGIAVGDFTGDGKADVVAIIGPDADTLGQSTGTLFDELELFAGKGDGTFQPPRTILAATSTGYYAVAAGDFNRDGKLDLAVINAPNTPVSTILTILLGDGKGGFGSAGTFSIGALSDLTIGDADGDGIPDIVTGGITGLQHAEGAVAVFRGKGDGTFHQVFTANEPEALIEGVLLADFRGTGKPDLAEVALTKSALLLEIRPGNGDGTFGMPVTITGAPSGGLSWWWGVAAGDWNGDGLADLAFPVINNLSFVQSVLGQQPGSLSTVAGLYEQLPAGDLAILLNGGTPPRKGPTIAAVMNAAGLQPQIEAGSWVTIFGTDLANTNPGRTWRSSEIVNGNLPESLDGVSVTIDGRPAYVYYISPGQINVQAPSDSAQGPVNVVVTNNGASSTPFSANLQPFSPAFFLYSNTTFAIASRYPDYALIADPSAISGTVAAKPGDILILWATGFGATNPPTSAGIEVTGAPAASTLPTVTVGGVSAQVIGVALTPGDAGLYQVAIQLPNNVPTGKVAVQASVGGFQSPAGVSIFVAKP